MSVNTYNFRAAVLDRPVAPAPKSRRNPSRPSTPVAYPRPVPVASPISVPRPVRVPRAAERAMPKFLNAAAVRASLFGCVFVLTYGVGALAGSVSVEAARRQEISAARRAEEAVKYTATLREQIETLTSRDSIDRWAQGRGMVDSRAVAPVKTVGGAEADGRVAER